jgi:hypothetical protein
LYDGCWRLVLAIYMPCSSIVFLLVILNGNSSPMPMSGPKQNKKSALNLKIITSELYRSRPNAYFKPLWDPGDSFASASETAARRFQN